MKYISFIIVIFMSVLIVYRSVRHQKLKNTGIVSQNEPINTGHEGDYIPEIELLLSDSVSRMDLAEVPSGRPIVLFYFITDCPYCEMQTDEIIKHIEDLKNIDFYLLTPYPHSYVKEFCSRYHLDKYINIKVGTDLESKFGTYFKTQHVPFIAIYNKEKKLESAFIGSLKYTQIEFVSSK